MGPPRENAPVLQGCSASITITVLVLQQCRRVPLRLGNRHVAAVFQHDWFQHGGIGSSTPWKVVGVEERTQRGSVLYSAV